MEFQIADTFTDALGKLTAQEQKAAKTTAFDLQLDPSAPGLQFHRIDKSKDPNFWSIRVNRDLRIIVHKTAASFLLAYVAHHNDAYTWAARRRIEAHPKTGAIQIVEVREQVEEIALPPQVTVAVAEPAPEPIPSISPLLALWLHDGCLTSGVKCFYELMGTEQFANPITLIATYARVSTARQEEERTIEVQLGTLRDFARERGYTIVKEYIDDGWSGDILARPSLDQLREDAKKKMWQAVSDLRPGSIGAPLLIPGARDG